MISFFLFHRVFIYFADHGGTGLICMPHGPYVYANDLISTLKFMHTNNMYKVWWLISTATKQASR